ncbi:hypothetical protein Tco_1100281, partial [Tanacetum coccineum]
LTFTPDQRQLTPALLAHLVDVVPVGDNVQTVVSLFIVRYVKNTPPMVTNVVDNEGALIHVRYVTPPNRVPSE